MQLLLTVFIMILATSVMAMPGDNLVITGSIVNLRQSPAMDAPVLLKLVQGRNVIEMKRVGDWIEVLTNRSDVESGWVHQSLLASLHAHTESNNVATIVDSTAFRTFTDKFKEFNESITRLNGFVLFIQVEEVDIGKLQITATPEWFSATQEQREEILSTVFEMWSDIVEPGFSILVQVVDEHGQPHMVMFR